MSKRLGLIISFGLIFILGLPLLIIKDNFYSSMEFVEVIYLSGKYFGFVAYFIFFFQYSLTAKVKIIENIFPYDIRIAIHRTAGFMGLLLLTLHPIFILFYYANFEIQLSLSFPIALGLVSFLIILVIGGSTFLGKILGVKYETWKKIHFLTFAVLTLAFFHALAIGSDLYSGFRVVWIILWSIHALLIAGKLLHKIILWSNTYDVSSVRIESSDVATIVVNRKIRKFAPGQFGFISLKIDSKWQSWHPFSISSSPDDRFTSFTIKNLGDFSSRIKEVKSGDKIKIDMPYGGFSSNFYKDKRYTFIAGGVGITPIFSMLSFLGNRDNPPEVTLLYSAHHESDILFKEKIDSLFESNKNWKLKYIVSSQPDWKGERGRITPDRIEELCENNLSGTFFLCGPIRMVLGIKKFLLSKGIQKNKIRTEQFEFIPGY